MLRDDVLKILTATCRENGYVSVATMQATPVWHALDPEVPLHLDMLGCMGSASSFGLGLALGAPDKKVLTVDGDGCLMMQLGTLVTIANARAANFALLIMNNGLYETSGNQPIPGAETADFVKLALAAGFPVAVRISDLPTLKSRIKSLVDGHGPTMIVLDIDRAEACKSWPGLSMKRQIHTTRDVFFGGRNQAIGHP